MIRQPEPAQAAAQMASRGLSAGTAPTGVPRLSMGLPVYNGEAYVSEAIESALAQTFGDFVLVISDNASTDGTEAICREYARRDERVHYIRNDVNIGAAPNYNQCFTAAPPSPYFKWLAHDDVFEPTYVEECLRALEARPTAALAFSGLAFTDASGRIERTQDAADLSIVGSSPGRRAAALIREVRSSLDVYWSVFGVIRREAILQTRLHGSYVASDQTLVFELALAGDLVQVPAQLFLRRRHERSFSAANTTSSARLTWFDPKARARVVLPHSRLCLEHFRAVTGSRAAPGDRLRGYVAATRRVAFDARNITGELKAAARELAGLR